MNQMKYDITRSWPVNSTKSPELQAWKVSQFNFNVIFLEPNVGFLEKFWKIIGDAD